MAVTSRSVWFCCVIQCDFPQQMDVFRWLEHDDRYTIIYIVHDRDRYDTDYCRAGADGHQVQYRAGDLIPPHIHMIVRLSRQCTAEALTKRFGAYVNFFVCADASEYAQYFTHDTFLSQDKHRYSPDCVRGDISLYYQLVRGYRSSSADIINRLQIYANSAQSPSDMVDIISTAGDADCLDYLAGHSYFVKTFILNL